MSVVGEALRDEQTSAPGKRMVADGLREQGMAQVLTDDKQLASDRPRRS
jgi:hypothetical protein